MKHEHFEKLSEVKLHYLKKYLGGDSILDVGAGYCYYSEWVRDKHPDARILALDLLELESHDGIEFKQADLEKPLDLKDESFESVLAFDIIEHITREADFVSELYRVCKPGGLMIGSVPHDDDKFLPAYNLTFNHRSDLTHKRYYVPTTLRQTLEQAGFETICLDKQGGINPQFFAELFPRPLQFLVKKCIGLLRRVGLINTSILQSDLFFVVRKPEKQTGGA